MTAQDATLLLGAFGAFMVLLGGGVKWMLTHLEAKAAVTKLAEQEARTALSDRLLAEIAVLRIEMEKLRVEKSIYLRRIYQLEKFIHDQPGVSIPLMEGWPPI